MKYIKIKYLSLLFIFSTIGCLTQQDQDLKTEATDTKNHTFYKNGEFLTSTVSAHKSAPIKIHFNDIASKALVNGKIPDFTKFPDGSLIVKDIYNSSKKDIIGYSIMKKDSKHENQAEGWLWVEYSIGVQYYDVSASEKGRRCLTCHTSEKYDRVQTFLVLP